MEIKPKVGIGCINFGMHPNQIIEIMNEDVCYEPWMGGNLNDSIYYKGLIFGFNECNGPAPSSNAEFRELRIMYRQDLTLFGEPLNSWTRSKISSKLSQIGVNHMSAVSGDISCDELSCVFSFDDLGQLNYIEMWRSNTCI